MLSKFYCDAGREADQAGTADVSALHDAIARLHPGKDVTVERLFPGGTLGTFWSAVVDGKKLFIKTCITGRTGQANLRKEIEIMKVLYGESLGIDSFAIGDGGSSKEFLVMDYLYPQDGTYSLGFVQGLISEYNTKTADGLMDAINYDTEDLRQAAGMSFEALDAAGFLSGGVRSWCEGALSRLVDYGGQNRILCHGDLSNKNIMIWKGNAVALDWEDAMMAYPGYDMLYWLTFYSQRRYYSCHLFDDIGIKGQYGKDIMAIILLVKCFLSYRDMSYLGNKLSFNDRIDEIIRM